MNIFVSFIVGLIFGLGLIISGMANPAKVLGFLDLAGKWDPSLMLVMGGALAVAFFAFRMAGKRSRPLIGFDMQGPGSNKMNRLVIGSTLFGIGWGIAGFCPGPAVVSLGIGEIKPVIFVAAMLSGMALFELLERRTQRHVTRIHEGT
jgi:uncharacterized membrane protein YedE/YeeE